MHGIVIYEDPYCYKENNEFIEWLTLSEEERERLNKFILENFTKIKNINDKHTSYGLKHLCSRKLGFYMSNADFKKSMTVCGFKNDGVKGDINWSFNISEKSIKKTRSI